MSSRFADLITINEIIDWGLKNGKTVRVNGSSDGMKKLYGNFQKQKEVETNGIITSDERSHILKPYQPWVHQQPLVMSYYQYLYVEVA